MSKNILRENLYNLPCAPNVSQELEGLCKYLENALPELRAIYVFGSQARGDWNEDSDVDIIVVVDERTFLEQTPNKRLLSRIDAAIVDYTIENPVSHIYFPQCYCADPIKEREEVLKHGESVFFLNNIAKDGVKIYDRE